MRKLIRTLCDAPGSTSLADAVFPGMESLVSAYIRENLEGCSDLKYNADLAKALIASEDFADLLSGHVNEYVIWKHLRDIVRLYVGEVNRSRPIRVSDRAKFGLHMETIGLNIGWSNDSIGTRSLVPDGNTLAFIVLTFALVLLFTRTNANLRSK